MLDRGSFLSPYAHRHDADFSLKTLRLAMEARFSHDFKDKKEQFKAWVVELIPELADDAAPPSKKKNASRH